MTRIGSTVKIKEGTHTDSFAPFNGKIGDVTDKEGKLYRVRFHEPVYIDGVGYVQDDLWEGKYLRKVRS